MYISPRLAVAAIVAAVVTALSGGSAFVVALTADTALVLVAVADVLLAPRPRALRFAREVPETTMLGRSEPVTLLLHNPTSRRLRVDVRDATLPSFGRDPARHTLTVPPGAWTRATGTIAPTRRGLHRVGPATIRTAGPFGLAGRQATLPSVDGVKIYPSLPGRREVELRLQRARLLQSGERSSAVRGGGGEFDSLRDYHPDDEFRRINWTAMARAGKPISNTFREERNQQVILLLDAGRLMAANVGGLSLFEHALDAAMAVAELSARVGDHVGAVAFGSTVRAAIGPRGGRAQSRRILDALFTVAPSLEAPNYRLAFATLLARYRRRSLIVLLTELTDEAALGSLFAAVPALLARHLVIVGAARDPSVEELATSMPRTSEDAYLKAAAVASLDARDRAAARLRRIGVDVVDRAPRDLAGAVADRYLRIKALGRL